MARRDATARRSIKISLPSGAMSRQPDQSSSSPSPHDLPFGLFRLRLPVQPWLPPQPDPLLSYASIFLRGARRSLALLSPFDVACIECARIVRCEKVHNTYIYIYKYLLPHEGRPAARLSSRCEDIGSTASEPASQPAGRPESKPATTWKKKIESGAEISLREKEGRPIRVAFSNPWLLTS